MKGDARGVTALGQRLVVYLALFVNAVLIIYLLTWVDWRGMPEHLIWVEAPGFGSGISPYDPIVGPLGYAMHYQYSPVALWLLQPVALLVGPLGWAALHLGSLAALPRRVGLVALISWPFWVDVLYGNVFTFVFVSAFLAVRRNRAGTIVYVVLTLLMPRPVQLPLLAWLLWRDTWLRWPFVALLGGHLALVASSGFGDDWLVQLLRLAGHEMAAGWNFGPTRLFGYAWFVVGLPVGLWLWRKYPALAGLAISPYLLAQYLLFLLVDVTNWPDMLRTRSVLPDTAVPKP